MPRPPIDQACDLGFHWLERQRLGEAEDAFRSALRLDPTASRAWHGLGNVWLQRGRPGDAAEAFRRALGPRPDHPMLRSNLALALHRNGQSTDAEQVLRRLLALQPDYYDAIVNLGVVLRDGGHWLEASRLFEQALALQPGMAKLRYDLGLLRLALGDFAAGWRDYELRWEANNTARPGQPGVPLWQGEPLAGKHLLLLAEQGFGDTLQFIRYAPLLARQGGTVTLACSRHLSRLMRRVDGLAAVVDDPGDEPAVDFQLPLMSLPHRLGTRLETIPADLPYLEADPADRALWAERLAGPRARRVGLVWAGAPRPEMPWAHEIDRRRSLPLSVLAPLGAVPGVRLISLQMGPPAAQLASAPPGLVLENPMTAVTDFADTAAIVANLDLVIAADTAVAHLAGGLGVPVWVLSRFDGCWRWLADRDDSPWYPGLRLFRQQAPGDWASVVADVASALGALPSA
jgi:Tfp pilus assembly protein PilF